MDPAVAPPVPTATRAAVARILAAALAAADPAAAVAGSATHAGGTRVAVGAHTPTIVDVGPPGCVTVLAVGKAAVAMADALLRVLDAAGATRVTGLVVTKDGHARGRAALGGACGSVDVVEAAHPAPDARGLAAAERALALAAAAGARGEDAVVFVLLSGGGSALLPLPAPPLTLDDVRATNAALLGCGASIDEVNCVRKHCSAVAGGRLAAAACGARVLTLALSDVPLDRLDVIASGPTVPDPTTFADAARVVAAYGLAAALPPRVLARLRGGADGAIADTPKRARPGDAAFVVGSAARSLDAAAAAAAAAGFDAVLLTGALHGEAREAGRFVAALAAERAAGDAAEGTGGGGGGRRPPWRAWPSGGRRPLCLLAGGETTVALGPRPALAAAASVAVVGGRNQELALSAAVSLAGALGVAASAPVCVTAFATDGTDGPTDAAGAAVSAATCAAAARLRLPRRPDEYLAAHDSGTFFADLRRGLDARGGGGGDVTVDTVTIDAAGLVRTGPTGTNVCDVIVVLVGVPVGRDATTTATLYDCDITASSASAS